MIFQGEPDVPSYVKSSCPSGPLTSPDSYQLHITKDFTSDEKSQIQALDRTAPLLPMRMGNAEKRALDYHRHGTSTLFAALEVATGQVTGAVKPRHWRQEFLSFLRQIDRAYPGQELHLVMDNYATHKTADVRQWLEAHPRFHIHFTPKSGSWMNLVKVWFGIIDRQAIKRGVFTSVKNLNKKIREFITGWNKRKHPFVWTKAPEQVLKKVKSKQTSETRHQGRPLQNLIRALHFGQLGTQPAVVNFKIN